MKKFLYLLPLLISAVANASVTVTVNATGLAGSTDPTAYIAVDLQNCTSPTIYNTGTSLNYNYKFPLSGGTVSVTLHDNISEISCQGNFLSYYTFSIVSGGVKTFIKNVELPPGNFNLADLANVTTPPVSPGIIQGPTGPGFYYIGPWVSGNTYFQLQIVTYNGVSYYALNNQDSSTVTPDVDTGNWSLVAGGGSGGGGGTVILQGDCAGTGSVTIPVVCLKTNGVAFGGYATANPASPPAQGTTTPNIVNSAVGSKQYYDTNGSYIHSFVVVPGSNGLPNGASCTVMHPFVSTSLYTATAYCSQGTLTTVYMSPARALGSEAFVQVLAESITNTTGPSFTASQNFISVCNSVSAGSTVTFAGTQNCEITTLTGNVTSSTITGAAPFQVVTKRICQDAFGAHSFVWPTNFRGAMVINSATGTVTASTCDIQTFETFDGTIYQAIDYGVANVPIS